MKIKRKNLPCFCWIKQLQKASKKVLKISEIVLLFLCVIMLILFVSSKNNISNAKNYDFDVDLVYLWCDGSDPAFVARKDELLKKETNLPTKYAIAPGRFIQVDELKYSLRSAEKYAPWVHHIYIVTDRQVPSWLNTNHPKITIVDHSEIMPSKYIPTFNTNTIEAWLHKIPGLSEHFLFSNDDMFFNKPVDKSFFFTEDGKVKIRFRKYALKKDVKRKSLYDRSVLKSISLVERDFGNIPYFSEKFLLQPHHNIDAYLKSDYASCVAHFEKEYSENFSHRFRTGEEIMRQAVSVYSFQKNNAILLLAESNKKSLSEKLGSLYFNNRSPIETYSKTLSEFQPALFCLNDTEGSATDDRIRTKKFLESWFPDKSSFEK